MPPTLFIQTLSYPLKIGIAEPLPAGGLVQAERRVEKVCLQLQQARHPGDGLARAMTV